MADFEMYLKVEAKIGNNTIETHIQNIKRVVKCPGEVQDGAEKRIKNLPEIIRGIK
jgi:hypothetical protein